jgi:hypothetical protein
MKSIISELLFDKEVVAKIKEAHIDNERLYNLLFNGKITMQEYLSVKK